MTLLVLQEALLPRVHRLCLTTTSAAVRATSLATLAALAGRFDQESANAMVATLQQAPCLAFCSTPQCLSSRVQLCLNL